MVWFYVTQRKMADIATIKIVVVNNLDVILLVTCEHLGGYINAVPLFMVLKLIILCMYIVKILSI